MYFSARCWNLSKFTIAVEAESPDHSLLPSRQVRLGALRAVAAGARG
jgi:hypothetical protein